MKTKKRRAAAACLGVLLALLCGCAQAAEGSPELSPESLAENPEPAQAQETPSAALQTLSETPESFVKFIQAGSTNLDIDAPVRIPELQAVGQYLAQPEPVDACRAAKALGANPENAKEPFDGAAQQPQELFFMADGGFEYVVNSTGFFGIEMTDLSAAYVPLPENRLSPSASGESGSAAAALETAQAAAAVMGLSLVPGEIEEYGPCPAQTAREYDVRPASAEGFTLVPLLHELDGLPLRYATRNVALFQEPPEGELHRYSYSVSPYLGLCFTVDSRGIRGLQGISYRFTKLRDAGSILPLQDAVEELIRNPDLLLFAAQGEAGSGGTRTIRVDEISFEYVYDKYYPTQLVYRGLQLDPMWCFSAQLDSGERGQLFVGAVDGRISWCFPERPLDPLPAAQPFSGSAYYEGE